MANRLVIDTLQIVLKTAERCNIDCTYCYYFNAGDETYKDRPGVIQLTTVTEIANFLAQGCREMKIPNLLISFHGGEPTMQSVQQFRMTCDIFKQALDPLVNLGFTMQTNGTLISDEWLDTLCHYQVDTGVSIDGPAIYNDMHRIDRKGKGTHHKVVEGIKKLNSASKEKRLQNISQISVLNANFNYRTVVKHLVEELDIRRLSFLLPDINYDTGFPDSHGPEKYGQILCDIFDLWSASPNFAVRQIDEIIDFFQEVKVKQEEVLSHEYTDELVVSKNFEVLVIQSDGTLALNDSWITSLAWQQSVDKPHLSDTSLAEYLDRPIFHEIREIHNTMPDDCQHCSWMHLCGAGDIENRYSENGKFSRKSIYCEGLKTFYRHVVNYLLKNGYPHEKIESRLNGAKRHVA